jgi:hypothetical protein
MAIGNSKKAVAEAKNVLAKGGTVRQAERSEKSS